jgi:hypothetical protein
MCIGLTSTVSSASPANMQENFEDNIKVTLIADSAKYELKKDNPLSIIVRIDNNSDRKVKLRHKPVFNFERVGFKEEDKAKLIFDARYTGRIASANSSNSENLFLDKGKYLEFVVDITQLELMDGMSSIDVWKNIFQELKNGDYNVQAEAVVDFSNGEEKNIKEFLSNKILISRKNDTENQKSSGSKGDSTAGLSNNYSKIKLNKINKTAETLDTEFSNICQRRADIFDADSRWNQSNISSKISIKKSEESLYYQALKNYLEKKEQEYSKVFPDRDFRNILVAKDALITKNLPTKIGVYSVSFVNFDELAELAKKNDSNDSEINISLVEMQPIKNEENKLVIKVIESDARYEKNRLSLSVSDGAKIYFIFDYSKQTYVVAKVEFFGI